MGIDSTSLLEQFCRKYKTTQMSRVGPVSPADLVTRVLAQGEDIRVIDLDIARRNFQAFQRYFDFADVHVAVKAVSEPHIFGMLVDAGAKFEIATLGEMTMCQEQGVSADRLLCSHPAKDRFEIERFVQAEVKLFVSDNLMDLRLMAKCAPGARVLIRIQAHRSEAHHATLLDQAGFDSRFGIAVEDAQTLIAEAVNLGLKPVGLALHVGVQQHEPQAWSYAIATAAKVFSDVAASGGNMEILDLGGGFPAAFHPGIPRLEVYAQTIRQALHGAFGSALPKIVLEPGRSIGAMAGITIGRVVNIKPGPHDPDIRVLTLFTGRFSACLFGIGMGVSFLRPDARNTELNRVTGDFELKAHLYGKVLSEADQPTMASGQANAVTVPDTLEVDDLVVFTGTGAYTGELFTHMCSKSVPHTIVFDRF